MNIGQASSLSGVSRRMIRHYEAIGLIPAAAREVRRLAQAHLEGVGARIAELRRIAGTLAHLVEHCHGGDRPECPILEALAGDAPLGTCHPEAGAASAAAAKARGRTAIRRTGAR